MTTSDTRSSSASLGRLHLLLTVQSVVVVLVAVNRKTGLTIGYTASNEFLRWVDLINLALPIASVIAFVLLRRWLESRVAEPRPRSLATLDVVLNVGVYLLAAGYGAHEVTNYLHERFCPDLSTAQCAITAFNDDEFSHWVFFAGFLIINVAVLILETYIPRRSIARRDIALIVVNGLFIAAGVFANLALEETGLDLPVVAVLVVGVVAVWVTQGWRPLVPYYLVAYGVGLAGCLAYKALT